MSERNTPFDGLEDLLERLNRQFETAARSWESELEGRSHLDLSMGGASTRLDLADHGDEFVVTVDVPGYGTEDLDLRLRGETLRLSGEREREVTEETTDPEDSGATYLRRERETQTFSRDVRLPEAVDADEITASVTNGILTVRLPKTAPSEDAHEIDIE